MLDSATRTGQLWLYVRTGGQRLESSPMERDLVVLTDKLNLNQQSALVNPVIAFCKCICHKLGPHLLNE